MAAITNLGKYWKDLYTFLSNSVTLVNECKALANSIRNVLNGDYVDGPTTMAIGSTASNVQTAAFEYYINGGQYSKAAACTALAGCVIPCMGWGAFRYDIGTNGTIDVIEAADNACGYTTAALALAGLPTVCADHASMGTVSVLHTSGCFVPGTTLLSCAGVCDVYADATTRSASISAAITTSDLSLTI